MGLGDTIETLKTKHHALEAAIDEENNRPHPDELEIASLKKQKLRIKDEIVSLQAH